MRLTMRERTNHISVEVHSDGNGYKVVLDGAAHAVERHDLRDGTTILRIDGAPYRVDVARLGRDRWVAVGGEVHHFVPESSAPPAQDFGPTLSPEVIAPMPGKVLQVLVRPGQAVSTGDGLVVLEAMKMETRLTAEGDGRVAEVRVAAGDLVVGGQILLLVEYAEKP